MHKGIVWGILILAVVVIAACSYQFLYTQEAANKIYTVQELSDILDTAPESLKNKHIQLKAYVVNTTTGVGCADYNTLADTMSTNDAVILTGRTLSMPEGFYPTTQGIYQGHFYDEKIMQACGVEEYSRFVIDKKIQELGPTPSAKPLTTPSPTPLPFKTPPPTPPSSEFDFEEDAKSPYEGYGKSNTPYLTF